MARICVPVGVRQLDELPQAMNAAAAVGDVVELRADCLPRTDAASLLEAVANLKRPLILTLRSPAQGGQTQNDLDARLRFWKELTALPADSLIDLELDLVETFSAGEAAAT